MISKFYLILWYIGIFLFISDHIFSQEYKNDSIKESVWAPSTSVFLELLGKSFYSVNVDFRRKATSAVSVGLMVGKGVNWHSIMYYRFVGKRQRFEIGGGTSVIFPSDLKYIAGIAIHGVIGYRYQIKKGLIFRIGFAPLYATGLTNTGRKMFVAWPGVSYGYSF
jgi:hypothetical protein